MAKLECHLVNEQAPQHTPCHFLSVSSKILFFSRTILKCDNEPISKSVQDVVIQACAGVDVFPQGPLQGDHMANERSCGDDCTRSESTMQNTSDFS